MLLELNTSKTRWESRTTNLKLFDVYYIFRSVSPMREHSRRRFIREILSASICTSAFSGVANRVTGRSNEGLTELCVIARQPGTLANAIIDVWSGQVGTLDLPQLPQDFGRSVVWDDVRGRGTLPR